MEKKILTLASALTLVSLCSFNAYADMDLETNNAVSGMAIALNNYKASSISPQKALEESLKVATTNTIEITGADDARVKLVNDTVKYEAPSIQDKLKEDIIKDNIAVADKKKDTVVHASAKETGEAVGSISYSSVATIVSTEVNESGEWLKISSGSVEGYVKASEVATGNKAKKMAKESIVTYATVVDIDNVRLRNTPDITSNTLTMLEGGEKFVVVGQDKNFVKLQVDDDLTGYVYKDFIKTDISYKTAKTTEESTIEALEKAKLETEAKEAMAVYENLVVADEEKTTAAKKEKEIVAIEDTTKAKDTTKSEETKTSKETTKVTIITDKTTAKVSEEPKTVKSPAAEKRETPASKEANINVPDTTKETIKAIEDKPDVPKSADAPKETLTSPETTVRETSKPTEASSKQETKVETTTETVEAKKEAETKKQSESIKAVEDKKKESESIEDIENTKKESESIKAIEDTKKESESIKVIEDTKKESGSIKAIEDTKKESESVRIETAKEPEASTTEATKPVETVKEPDSTKSADTVEDPNGNKLLSAVKESETIKAVEDTSKQPSTTKAETTTQATTQATTAARYGPGGNSEKPKETEAKTTAAQKETSVVTGENGGPGVSKSKETAATTTAAATKAAKEKASRSAIVAYAKQFVGNPYVYGGTSLTNGADCSGFVMRVYEHFDISTGRNSRQQANKGTEISISDVQPGDLLFYGSSGEISHVAIYVGDGKIVHAANKELGITVGSGSYRSPIKAVTFLR